MDVGLVQGIWYVICPVDVLELSGWEVSVLPTYVYELSKACVRIVRRVFLSCPKNVLEPSEFLIRVAGPTTNGPTSLESFLSAF